MGEWRETRAAWFEVIESSEAKSQTVIATEPGRAKALRREWCKQKFSRVCSPNSSNLAQSYIQFENKSGKIKKFSHTYAEYNGRRHENGKIGPRSVAWENLRRSIIYKYRWSPDYLLHTLLQSWSSLWMETSYTLLYTIYIVHTF